MAELKIKTAFNKDNIGKKNKFYVKVLAKTSENEFLIGDTSGHCRLSMDNPKPNAKNYVVPKAFIRILNAKLDMEQKRLILINTSSVFTTKVFEKVVEPETGIPTSQIASASASPIAKIMPKASGDILERCKLLLDYINLDGGKVRKIYLKFF